MGGSPKSNTAKFGRAICFNSNKKSHSPINPQKKRKLTVLEKDSEPLAFCGCPAAIGLAEDFASPQKHTQCQEITKDKPILLLAGVHSHGSTGNNLTKFLHAIQEARDNDMQLGIMAKSWATNLLMET